MECPSQRIGNALPSFVKSIIPTLRSSTAISPSVVRMLVPAIKHGGDAGDKVPPPVELSLIEANPDVLLSAIDV